MQRLILLFSVSCAALITLSWPTWSAEGPSAPTEISSADVNVVSVKGGSAGGRFVCEAVINNQNDDEAADATVIMLLPLQVTNVQADIYGGGGKCKKEGAGSYTETVICELGNLPQGSSVLRTIRVTMEPSTAGPNYPPTCGAFIYSRTGDLVKKNNYCYWPDGEAVCLDNNKSP